MDLKNFEFAKVIKPLRFSDYAPSYKDEAFLVWVNPSQDVLGKLHAVQAVIMGVRGDLEANQKEIAQIKKDLRKWETRKSHKQQAENIEALKAALEEAQDGDRITALNREMGEANDAVFNYYSTLLSQDPDPSTHIPADTIEAFATKAMKSDPALWPWIMHTIQQMIQGHRESSRKK